MGLVKPSNNTFAKIKVIGIGGGGGNAINTMISAISFMALSLLR